MNFSKKNNEHKNININVVSKKVRLTTIIAIAFLGISAISCNDNDLKDYNPQNSDGQKVLAEYMVLKEALVETNKDQAAEAGNNLHNTLSEFDVNGFTVGQQKELKGIIADAKEQAELIGKSEMVHQREHFKTLSMDIMEMISIIGTENTLYQQYCPMYDGGSAWLSMSKEIKNPYYGSKMMNCGNVQKVID